MKIIILYASAGAGHRRAAEALYNEFSGRDNVKVIIKDALEFTTPSFKLVYGGGYEFVVRYLPWLWAIIFYISDSRFLRPIIFALRTIVNSSNTGRLERYLEEEKPDTVITTQFLMTEVISRMRRRGEARFKFICVITDFEIHAYWVSKLVDEYIVATNYTKEILETKFGIDEDKIAVLGIPIHQHFSIPKDRVSLFKKFNVEPNKFTVLIIAGTFGMGPLKRIATELAGKNQIIIGCGKNKKLLAELTNLASSNINLKPIGFVDYVDELMALSDCIITKPGGLTISESLACGLPMIFIAAIKGQETRNARFISNLGIGFNPRSLKEIPGIIENLRDNPGKMHIIKETIKNFAKADSAAQIVNHILKINA